MLLLVPARQAVSEKFPNYVTPKGFCRLQDELKHLLNHERPEVVRVVSWAAGNGDRSENGDYIYGKRRLGAIDRRIHHLNRQIISAKVVRPGQQEDASRVFFGATVKLVSLDREAEMLVLRIVGIDEAEPGIGMISWVSPAAKAMLGKRKNEEVSIHGPQGSCHYKILFIGYEGLAD